MNIKQKENKFFMHTYKRSGLSVKKAKKQFIWDQQGKKYLDFFAGISVCNLGHCNDAVVKAAKKQLGLYAHVSNLYYASPQIELGAELVKKTFAGGKVFISNSGAEANECAVKLARKWGFMNPSEKGNRYEIIAFNNSFHGRTVMTLSATGQKKFHEYLKPLPEKFVFAEMNDISSVKKLINERTAAVIIEPIQGEGGLFTADKKFMKELRDLCDKEKLILIFDEIQCGMGRTGKFYAFENYGIKPDIVTLAKSLANGLPIGATIASEKYAQVFTYGDHGSTFGGNPVSCAAALAVLKIIDGNFLKKVAASAKYLNGKLETLKKKYPVIKQVRGMGLMTGLALGVRGREIVDYCLGRGLIINCTHETVLRFLPPLIINKQDIDAAVKILDEAFEHFAF